LRTDVSTLAVGADARRMTASNPYKHMVPATVEGRPGTAAQEVFAPMHTQPKQADADGFARLERVILGLLVYKHRHPWSIEEIEREIGTESTNVPPAIHRLDEAGLIHSWDDLVCPTHALMRAHEITEPNDDADSAFENGWDRRVFVLLLASTHGLSEQEVRRELATQGDDDQIAVADALNRLYGAGLVDRKDGLATASQAGTHFDRTMTL
jgi:predicted transcriptional regulator